MHKILLLVFLLPLFTINNVAAQQANKTITTDSLSPLTMMDVSLFATIYHSPDGKRYLYTPKEGNMHLQEITDSVYASLKNYHHQMLSMEVIEKMKQQSNKNKK